MDRGGTGSGLDQGNTSSSEDGLRASTTVATVADILDDSSLHGKFDKIEREEPNDILTKQSTRHTDSEQEK